MCMEEERGDLIEIRVFGGLTVACVWSEGGDELWSIYFFSSF